MGRKTKTGICKLCETEAPLAQSHIIPEFLCAATLDEKRQNVHFVPGRTRESIRQSGPWERLLCVPCERILNQYETPTAAWIRSAREKVKQNEGKRLVGVPCDYRTLKLFIMSLIWRCAVAKSGIELGPHKERMRRALVDGEPGVVTEYPFGLLAYPRAPEAAQVVRPAMQFRMEGRWAWKVLAGGFQWFMVTARDADALHHAYPWLFSSAEVAVLLSRFDQQHLMQQHAENLRLGGFL